MNETSSIKLTIAVTFGVVISTLTNGITIPILWGWFIVPIFHAPPLTFWAAVGVSLVINFIKPSYAGIPLNTDHSIQYDLLIAEISTNITRSIMSLALGLFAAWQMGIV